jgi:gluconate 2-dehydrogenase gamma chain
MSGRTRRELLRDAGIGAFLLGMPPKLLARAAAAVPASVLNAKERRTLRAAVARMVPASGPGDWSAADAGADNYIAVLLAGPEHIFAGGPNRAEFAGFQTLSRVKQLGWSREVERLRGVYHAGLKDLDARAAGDFAAAPAPLQDTILRALDLAGGDFFAALYKHTMEGVYSHPVYGGNTNYLAWRSLGYQGDVHGVRFPGIGPADAPWNVYGGYAPEEMAQPGRET